MTTIVVKDPRPDASRRRHARLPTLRTVKPTKNGFTTATADGNWRVALDEMPPPALTNDILTGVEQCAEQAPESNSVELVDEVDVVAR